MSSFSNSGGEDGGDICNIFDFDEDDDVAGMMQSEWDEDTSTTNAGVSAGRSVGRSGCWFGGRLGGLAFIS